MSEIFSLMSGLLLHDLVSNASPSIHMVSGQTKTGWFLIVLVRVLVMIELRLRRIDVVGRQRFAAMIETVERRQIAERLPRLGLQVDGGADLLEFANDLQQAPDDQEQAGDGLDQDL